MVGAPFRTNDSLYTSGKVYFIFGGDSLSGAYSLSDPNNYGAYLIGEASYDRLGYSLSYAGMTLGDGTDLSLISAPYNNSYKGRSYLCAIQKNSPPSAVDSVSIEESSIWFGQTIHIELTGTDADPNSLDVAVVKVTTETDPNGIMVRLIETGINTGIYQAEVDVDYKASNPSTKRIKADLGDNITVTSVDDPSEQDSVELPVPTINVTHIKFDHEGGEDSDAVDIREDCNHDIPIPEWVKDERNEYACYLKDTNVSIMARFSVSPNTVSSAIIGADSIDGSGSLGDVLEETVPFTDGNSPYVKFWINGTTPSIVDRTLGDRWQWYFENVDGSGSEENNANISGPHKICTILDDPQSPMTEPWLRVLKDACDWAEGESTELGALEEITIQALVGDVGSEWKDYDGSRSHAYGTTFNLTAFIDANWADCRDMSACVHVYSRAIGCSTRCRIIDGPFYCKPIWPVGYDTPLGAGTPWNFHQVAVRQDDPNQVYDACVGLYLPGGWDTPTNMAIYGSYKYYLYLGPILPFGGWNPQTAFNYTTIL